MDTIATGTFCIDTLHAGNKQTIACALLEGGDGPALLDPGPASTLPAVRRELAARGIGVGDLRALLLTHIHLDHAGATGTLVKENAALQVYVHERGAPHMAEPQKLLESAGRLYGAEMDRLWGEFLPTPAANLHALGGGEEIVVAGRRISVAYTPGHASHHVSYFDDSTGVAFTGDTAGIRIANQPGVFPPTPPPDINLEVWRQSIDLIRARRPQRLFLTHFSAASPVPEHLDAMTEALARWSERVRLSLIRDASDEQRIRAFTADVRAELTQRLPAEEAERYMTASTPGLCWLGLARYWRKRAQAAPSAGPHP